MAKQTELDKEMMGNLAADLRTILEGEEKYSSGSLNKQAKILYQLGQSYSQLAVSESHEHMQRLGPECERDKMSDTGSLSPIRKMCCGALATETEQMRVKQQRDENDSDTTFFPKLLHTPGWSSDAVQCTDSKQDQREHGPMKHCQADCVCDVRNQCLYSTNEASVQLSANSCIENPQIAVAEDAVDYLEKFVFACGLFNAALLRTTGDTQLRDSINQALTETHTEFIRITCPNKDADSTLKRWFMQRQVYLERLDGIRATSKAHADAIATLLSVYCVHPSESTLEERECVLRDTVEKAHNEIAANMRDFWKNLIDDCIKTIGPPPCRRFCVLGFGSLARVEITPYSDFEFAVLVSDQESETQMLATQQYFKTLTRFLHLIVLEYKETPLPSLGIPLLNDFYSEESRASWFYDDITPSGIKFDGGMPWACITPVGRKRTLTKNPICFIMTTAEMADLQNTERKSTEGYHLAEVFVTPTLITGDYDLLDDYKRRIWENISVSGAKCRAQNALREYITSYSRRMMSKGDDSFQYRAKHDMYRIPTLILAALRVLFRSRRVSTWDFLMEITHDRLDVGKSFAREITTLLALSLSIRLLVYCEKNRQSELFCPSSSISMQLQAGLGLYHGAQGTSLKEMSRVSPDIFVRHTQALDKVFSALEEFLRTDLNGTLEVVADSPAEDDLRRANLFIGLDVDRGADYYYKALNNCKPVTPLGPFTQMLGKAWTTDDNHCPTDDFKEQLQKFITRLVLMSVAKQKSNGELIATVFDFMGRMTGRFAFGMTIRTLKTAMTFLQSMSLGNKIISSETLNQMYITLRFLVIVCLEESLHYDDATTSPMMKREVEIFVQNAQSLLDNMSDRTHVVLKQIVHFAVAVSSFHFLQSKSSDNGREQFLDMARRFVDSSIFSSVERMTNHDVFSRHAAFASGRSLDSCEEQSCATSSVFAKFSKLSLWHLSPNIEKKQCADCLEFCKRMPASIRCETFTEIMNVTRFAVVVHFQQEDKAIGRKHLLYKHALSEATDVNEKFELLLAMTDMMSDGTNKDYHHTVLERGTGLCTASLADFTTSLETSKMLVKLERYEEAKHCLQLSLTVLTKDTVNSIDQRTLARMTVFTLLGVVHHKMKHHEDSQAAFTAAEMQFRDVSRSDYAQEMSSPVHNLIYAHHLSIRSLVDIDRGLFAEAYSHLTKARNIYSQATVVKSSRFNNVLHAVVEMAFVDMRHDASYRSISASATEIQESISILFNLIRNLEAKNQSKETKASLLHINMRRWPSEQHVQEFQQWMYGKVVLMMACSLQMKACGWRDALKSAMEALQIISNIPEPAWNTIHDWCMETKIFGGKQTKLGCEANIMEVIAKISFCLGEVENYLDFNQQALDRYRLLHGAATPHIDTWGVLQGMAAVLQLKRPGSDIALRFANMAGGMAKKLIHAESTWGLESTSWPYPHNKSLARMASVLEDIHWNMFQTSQPNKVFRDIWGLYLSMENISEWPNVLQRLLTGLHYYYQCSSDTQRENDLSDSSSERAAKKARDCLQEALDAVGNCDLPMYKPPHIKEAIEHMDRMFGQGQVFQVLK